MKNIFKYGLLSTVALISFSCEPDFLEDPVLTNTGTLTSVQFEQAAELDPSLPTGLMSGVYALTFDPGSGGTSGADDFGMKSYDIFSDMMSGDMALSKSTYGWYRASITEFGAHQDFTYGDNRQVWRYYYRIIRGCNAVIDGLGGMDATPESQANKYTMGQAKALRAHSYFYLTQFYQKEYTASEPILPIYRSAVDQNGAKVPASEIYDLMESDLTDAVALLEGFNRDNKTEINQDVAKAIYAYVLGARGTDYQKAYNMAVGAINSYALLPGTEVENGFNNVATPGWMWGVDLNNDIGLGLTSWWGKMDYFSYSYAAYGDNKAMDTSLFAQIPADDVRKGQYYDRPTSSLHLMPLFKFYDEDRVRAGSSTTVKADYVYMRVAEMHLLAAEMAAYAGNDASARGHLKDLVGERVPNESYIDALSGQGLKNEIYLQTRIELWGEGKSFLALKRNKATATRGSNHLSLVGVPIPYNDERMSFEIPESEIQFNPYISQQNL